MQISLIVTTYNWPEALRLSLHSALAQSQLPAEIVVADDGSGPATAELVRAIGVSSPVPVIHSWQEDKGFRSARSRNRAIAKARGEYLLFIDGDIVLEQHFVADHCAFARPGFFVQGPRALLGEHPTARMLAGDLTRISPLTGGIGNRKNCLRSPMLARLFSRISTGLSGIKTCNFAFWKRDALRVNGFNEEFTGWGREDSEFAARLLNAGLRRQNLRFCALGAHLAHPLSPRERLAVNDAILRRTIEERRTWCAQGLDQHLGIIEG